MKKNLNFLVFICFYYFFSCKSEPKLVEFKKVYEGFIDKHSIIAQINVTKNKIEGNYFYSETCGELRLEGNIIGKDSFYVKEFEKQGKNTGIFTGRLTDGNNNIIGVWKDSLKQYTFNLISANLDYLKELDKAKKIKANNKKVNIVDITGSDGFISLPPKNNSTDDNNNKTFISVDYKKYNKKFKKIDVWVIIGDENIKGLNKEIQKNEEKGADILSSYKNDYMSARIIQDILNNLSKNKTFDEKNGSHSNISIFLLNINSGINWKSSSTPNNIIETFERRTGYFHTQIDEDKIPENGFDIGIENLDDSFIAPNVKFEIKVLGTLKS